MHLFVHRNLMSFNSRLCNGWAICEKSWMNHLQNPIWLKNQCTSLTVVGFFNLKINSTLALSTSIPLSDITWPRTIPCLTMMWRFYLFSTKPFSIHLFNTFCKFSKQAINEGSWNVMSSINTSISFSKNF